jgi:hypothetical protein
MYRANMRRTGRVEKYSISKGLIKHLVYAVKWSGLRKGTNNSMVAKLSSAVGALEDEQPKPAVNKIKAFVNEVDALTGKKLAVEEAGCFIENAFQIMDAINSVDD